MENRPGWLFNRRAEARTRLPLRSQPAPRRPSPSPAVFDFDQWAQELAEGLSRREALRRLGVGLAAVLLASLGLLPAEAAAPCPPGRVLCKGRCCPAGTTCCDNKCCPGQCCGDQLCIWAGTTCCLGPNAEATSCHGTQHCCPSGLCCEQNRECCGSGAHGCCPAHWSCCDPASNLCCPPGQHCASGSCVTTCPTNTTLCSGTHRSACCQAGENCCDGRCCPSGRYCCGGDCRVCPCDKTLCAGSQGTNCCGAGQTCCDGACVDTQRDLLHCGTCSHACPTPAHTMPTCAGGMCGFTCLAGYADCNHQANDGCEVNTTNDTHNCGACAHTCAAGQSCVNSQCTCGSGGDCPSGKRCCGGLCTDTASDAANCGSCGNICGTGQGCCSGMCADLNTSSHCGACGRSCPAHSTCAGGECQCDQGYTACGTGPAACCSNATETCQSRTGVCLGAATTGCGGNCPANSICVDGQCSCFAAGEFFACGVGPGGVGPAACCSFAFEACVNGSCTTCPGVDGQFACVDRCCPPNTRTCLSSVGFSGATGQCIGAECANSFENGVLVTRTPCGVGPGGVGAATCCLFGLEACLNGSCVTCTAGAGCGDRCCSANSTACTVDFNTGIGECGCEGGFSPCGTAASGAGPAACCNEATEMCNHVTGTCVAKSMTGP